MTRNFRKCKRCKDKGRLPKSMFCDNCQDKTMPYKKSKEQLREEYKRELLKECEEVVENYRRAKRDHKL